MGDRDEFSKRSRAGSATDADSDALLNEALSDLEQILDVRNEDAHPRIEQRPGGAQYTIPLLDDVVVPGSAFEDDDANREPAPIISIELDDEAQAVVKRLTNEIEVIVQSAMEETLKRANKDITAKVRKHMNIVLSEILDELSDIKTRKGM